MLRGAAMRQFGFISVANPLPGFKSQGEALARQGR